MAEVVGPRASFPPAGLTVTVYYDDVTGQPTRVVAENPQGKVVCYFEVSSGDRTKKFTTTIPSGTTEWQVTPAIARKINILTGDYSFKASVRK